MPRWPDFFIVGAPKAGTSSLYALLRRSPDVYMPTLKEPRFFNTAIDRTSFMSGSVTAEAAYLSLFAGCSAETARCGEASPSYLVDPTTPARIHEKSPDADIIVMIRNPIDRAHSHYLFHEVRTGRTNRSFGEAIDECATLLDAEYYHPRFLLQPGFYARQIARYQATFGHDSVHVVFYDDFVADTTQTTADVCAFLNVALPDDIELSSSQRNAASAPRGATAAAVMRNRPLRWVIRRAGLGARAVTVGKRWLLRPAPKQVMTDLERRRLAEIYAADTAALEELLGRPVPWGSAVRSLTTA